MSQSSFPDELGCEKVASVSYSARSNENLTLVLQIISDRTRAEGGNAVEDLSFVRGVSGAAMHCPVGAEFAEHGVQGTLFFPATVPEAPSK